MNPIATFWNVLDLDDHYDFLSAKEYGEFSAAIQAVSELVEAADKANRQHAKEIGIPYEDCDLGEIGDLRKAIAAFQTGEVSE